MFKKPVILLITLLSLFSTVFSAQAQLLDPVKWSFSAKKTGDQSAELVLSATIEKKWHLYSQFLPEGGPIPTSFKFDKAPFYSLKGNVEEKSKPEEAFDKNFDMTLKYFENKAVFVQKIEVKSDGVVKGMLEFMVCDDKQCLPPTEVPFEIKLSGFGAPAENSPSTSSPTSSVSDTASSVVQVATSNDSSTSSTVDKPTTATPEAPAVAASDKANSAEEKGMLGFLLTAFLYGLAAVMTPCVFPMLPMTVTFFIKQSGSKAQAMKKALCFGASIIGIYALIGLIFGLLALGADFGNWLSTHWIPNVLFFLIFIVFGASFLGMFEITLPHKFVNSVDQKSDMKSLAGIFFMAFTLVLVSFSCTGPVVGTLLIQAVGGEMLKPMLGLSAFGLGLAGPFMLFAAFPGWLTNLPKSGGWLNSVKVVLGFLEIAFAFKFLSTADQVYHWGILDREVYLAIWIVSFSLMGLYLLGKLKFSHDSDLPYLSVPRLGLAMVAFTFVVYLIPGLFGAPLKALSGYLPPQSTLDFDLTKGIGTTTTPSSDLEGQKVKFADLLPPFPHQLKGFYDYKEALAHSKKTGKPIFIDFTGHGCVNCREMEANVWSDPEVLKRLQNDFILLAQYVDDKTELPESEWYTSKFDGQVKKTIGKQNADFQITRFNANAQPYYVIMDGNGNQIGPSHAYDKNVASFIQFLDQGKAGFQTKK